jgi:hypothetical protein
MIITETFIFGFMQTLFAIMSPSLSVGYFILQFMLELQDTLAD